MEPSRPLAPPTAFQEALALGKSHPDTMKRAEGFRDRGPGPPVFMEHPADRRNEKSRVRQLCVSLPRIFL
jgi:hypothetical protein